MLDEEQHDDVCPKCSGTDITLEHVTLRFGVHMMADGTLDKLGVKDKDHKNFPILRCHGCGNVALSKTALIEIMPALADRDFELHQMTSDVANSHAWN